MKTLVIGATGHIGGHVTRDLMDKGESVRALTRTPEHAHYLPEGVDTAVGDLVDPDALGSIFEGMEAVFMVTPLHPRETDLGLNAVEAAKRAGVRRMVYSSVIMPPGAEGIPHFLSKLPVEDAVKNSGFEWTILRPSNFYQNDLGYKESILKHGVYPEPIGHVGVNRVDVRDIADAAVNAFINPAYAGRTYDVGGPDEWTGDSVAQVWSKCLKRDVRYAGDDLDAWQAQVTGHLPEFLIHDLRLMFDYFQTEGLPLPESAKGPLREILGHAPRKFEAFAKETAEMWGR